MSLGDEPTSCCTKLPPSSKTATAPLPAVASIPVRVPGRRVSHVDLAAYVLDVEGHETSGEAGIDKSTTHLVRERPIEDIGFAGRSIGGIERGGTCACGGSDRHSGVNRARRGHLDRRGVLRRGICIGQIPRGDCAIQIGENEKSRCLTARRANLKCGRRPFATCPVGPGNSADIGMATKFVPGDSGERFSPPRRLVLPVTVYRLDVFVPWFEIQKGLPGSLDTPHVFFRFESVMAAMPGDVRDEVRLLRIAPGRSRRRRTARRRPRWSL